MKMNGWMAGSVVTAIMLAAGLSPCSANLITNGSFEDGTSTGSYTGITSLPGWTLTYNQGTPLSFDWYMTSAFTPAEDGSRLINFADLTNQGWITQAFSVTASTTYTVSYWEKYRDSNTAMAASVTAASGILTLGSWSAAVSGTGTSALTQITGKTSDWTNYTFSFTPANSTSITLKFSNNGRSVNGTYLDNVSVVAAPEPASLALLGLGGLMMLPASKKTRAARN